MSSPILGLHHVTATVDDAQADLDFSVDALGLRLVKKTVNFDNHFVYHFYYGDEVGHPGTIWTTFPYKGRGVPVGAKGGFVVKRPPADGDRAALMAEVESCYRTFIHGLLDLTDNIVGGEITPPPRVVRYDEDDPYLVVAADRGTATFSDIANSISAEYGHWLGDAFASGGSIVIVGGGYAGFYAAWNLEKTLRPDEAEITVIDPRPYMTYQPFLPEVMAGSVEARHAAWIRRVAGSVPAPDAFDEPKARPRVERLVASTEFVVADPVTRTSSEPRFTG